jgi:hypothetical protein
MEEGKACCQNSPVEMECFGGSFRRTLNSQLIPLSGVDVLSYVAWRAGMATPLSGLAE